MKKKILTVEAAILSAFVLALPVPAQIMQHWANVRYADGKQMGTVYEGEYVEVISEAEDPYRSYVYVPKLGGYGYICSVYIYGGSEWEYEHPFEYNSFNSSAASSYVKEYNDYTEEYDSYKEEYNDYTDEADWVSVAYNTWGGYNGVWIETDIGNQVTRLWNGKNILIEDDCVTGTDGITSTPTGYFEIENKERNQYLTDGATYNAFVNFWMPFCGGFGFHDALWRENFGGTIYKEAGSHGCVNLSYSMAKIIWETIEVGTPVVIHY